MNKHEMMVILTDCILGLTSHSEYSRAEKLKTVKSALGEPVERMNAMEFITPVDVSIDNDEIRYASADRSDWNESKAKGMAGCLHIDGVVLAYIPFGVRACQFAVKHSRNI